MIKNIIKISLAILFFFSLIAFGSISLGISLKYAIIKKEYKDSLEIEYYKQRLR